MREYHLESDPLSGKRKLKGLRCDMCDVLECSLSAKQAGERGWTTFGTQNLETREITESVYCPNCTDIRDRR